jgi:hypothetical protein
MVHLNNGECLSKTRGKHHGRIRFRGKLPSRKTVESPIAKSSVDRAPTGILSRTVRVRRLHSSTIQASGRCSALAAQELITSFSKRSVSGLNRRRANPLTSGLWQQCHNVLILSVNGKPTTHGSVRDFEHPRNRGYACVQPTAMLSELLCGVEAPTGDVPVVI